ncbi:MAG: TlpA family protein disulfide reductase [Verrucomicrobiae bacterium]|nr:TlpA family protein disulfide reductase [Verrucomicrobiae bacterium]
MNPKIVASGLAALLLVGPSACKPKESETAPAPAATAPVLTPPSAPTATAGPAASDAEEAAWLALIEGTAPPLPPAEWNQQQPSEEEYAAFRKKMGESAAATADRAKAFLERFPDSEHADDAKEIRSQMLGAAVRLGQTDRADELAAIGGEGRPGGPFEQKMGEAVQKAMAQQEKGMEAVLTTFEEGIREVMKEFPDRPEVYGALLEVANGVGAERAREIAKEIQGSAAPDGVKEAAAALIAKYDRVGQPLDLKFTAIDGREVSIADLKGKVVLVDFWATWCGPCVVELPNVKAAFDKLHPEGFEIVGISFDHDKEALEAFLKKHDMPWPQFFDGEGWQNKFGQEFGINSIPAMWLVDAKGVLRDLNARDGLADKVQKLLAER